MDEDYNCLNAVENSIRMEGPVLHAVLLDAEKNKVPAQINLDGHLGNFNGPDKLPVLHAELLNDNGNFVPAQLMVGNWLFNNDGHFEFLSTEHVQLVGKSLDVEVILMSHGQGGVSE
ncbi:hypothetical protein APSETT444_010535 [Aspergillus pseudonomiae]